MRLLHFRAGTLVLTNFTGRPIPPYAILSHRWSSSEVLFEDILADKTQKERKEEREGGQSLQRRTQGWQKINFCAQKAAQHNLEYFWIDSCCIDKWDYAELDRSVNMMFKWYRDAAKCFVFLQDVNASQESCWEMSFRRSSWFTRGWTLQELIAPASVDFYDSQGSWLGDKTSLQEIIHEVTNVPKQALNGQIEDFSYTERLQWSANRFTTEPEDQAYCLLGILGVGMSLTYGEGKAKAMVRLKQELETADRAPCVIPHSRNEDYTGQEATLTEMSHGLFSKDKLDILVVTGKSGLGKSSLALEFSHRTRDNRSQCSVFWVDAGNEDTLQQSYSDIARKLHILRDLDQLRETIAAVHHYLRSEEATEWLLVYDNLEDSSIMSHISSGGSQQGTLGGLPTSIHGSIIVTTTRPEVAKHLPATTVTMPELTGKSGSDVLEVYLRDFVAIDEEQDKIEQLGTFLNRPLVMVVATAYLRVSQVAIGEYIAMIQAEISVPTAQESVADRSINVIIELSLRHIIEHNPQAADALFLLACFARQDIPITLLRSDDASQPESTIALLGRYALITRRPASSAIDIHQLIYNAIRRRTEAPEHSDLYTKRALQQITRAFPDPDDMNRSHWRRYIPHARHILDNSDNEDDFENRKLLAKCGEALGLDGRYEEARVLQARVVKSCKTVLGEDHVDTLNSMSELVLAYNDLGRWQEAEELGLLVLEKRKSILGREHLDTLTSMSYHALTLWHQGRWQESESLGLEVVSLRRKVLGRDHPDTLTSMSNLALVYDFQGRWQEAEELGLEVVGFRKTVLGPDHPETLLSMSNLALAYEGQGRPEEAEELGLEVIGKRKIVLGHDHPDTLMSMNNLAMVYEVQGRFNEAEQLGLEVVEKRKTVLGQDHPDTLMSISNLAWIYDGQGRWKEAEEVGLGIVERKKALLGRDHPETLLSMSNLALTYCNQGRWNEAEKLELEVLGRRKTVLGADHPHTHISEDRLSEIHHNQGRRHRLAVLARRVVGRFRS